MALDSEMQDLLVECCRSTRVCAKAFFPDRFTREFSSGHYEIFDALDDDSIPKLAISAPRGIGKTSIVNLVVPAQRILYQKSRFIVPVSATATSAEAQALNLRTELETNPTIKALFGELKCPDTWAKADWLAKVKGDKIGTKVNPKGAGQQIRGLIFGNNRPDLIIIDDLEEKEAVRSEERRKNLKDWFKSDVLNSVDRGSDNWRIIVIGTILHEDSLLNRLIGNSDWEHIELQIADDLTFETRWPELISTHGVKKLMEEHQEDGNLDLFYMEFMGMAIATIDATFKQEMFRYYEPTDPESVKAINECQSVVLVDPAKTVKMHSADSAIIGVSVDIVNNCIYVRDIVAGKLHPDELYKAAYDMSQRIGARMIGLEVTSLDEFITKPFQDYLRMQGSYIQIKELKARKKKEDRIAALVSYYRQHLIFHNKAVTRQLEQQLLMFPRPKRWDQMDALAYIIEMMEHGDQYFSAQVIAHESREDVEKEYASLAAEDARMGDLSTTWQLDRGIYP